MLPPQGPASVKTYEQVLISLNLHFLISYHVNIAMGTLNGEIDNNNNFGEASRDASF